MTHKQLEDAARRYHTRRAAAREEFVRALERAQDRGMSLRQIAGAVGLTPEGVRQIIQPRSGR